jgi:hypothetical protein
MDPNTDMDPNSDKNWAAWAKEAGVLRVQFPLPPALQGRIAEASLLRANDTDWWKGYVRVLASTPGACRVMELPEETAGVHGGITMWAQIWRGPNGEELQRKMSESAQTGMTIAAQLSGRPLADVPWEECPPPPGYTLVAFELGFDAGQGGDWVPALARVREAGAAVYCDIGYMREHCLRLATAMSNVLD